MADLILRNGRKLKKVNRLFLVGNGFDLALGLKTKYSDFLFWLLKKETINAVKSDVYETSYPKAQSNYNQELKLYEKLRINGYAKNDLFEVFLKKSNFGMDYDLIFEIDNLKDLYDFNFKRNIEIKPINKDLLFQKIIDISEENWIDIENVYFELLKSEIDRKNFSLKSNDKLIELNNELTLITSYLTEYLKSLKIEISKNDALNYFKHFNEKLEINDFLEYNPSLFNVDILNTYFLNFNYTKSLTILLSHFKNFKCQQNHIHNNLEDNELIFGFGDEMDSIYKKIEEMNDNRYFKHIKSFHYFKTSKQRDLQRFLNSGDYQVCVYGHSCGLSDRVMLNEIFEHENCKSIKIYYYNDEDFTTKTMEISRHFSSNQLMRKKIVEKSVDCLIPQIMHIDK